MGIIKTGACLVLGFGIFYGGMLYERSHAEKKIDELNKKVEVMSSIDYKIESLIEEKAVNPERVDSALERLGERYEVGGDGR